VNKLEQGRSSGLDLAVTCLRGVRDGEDRSHEWEHPHAISRIEISIPLPRHMSGVLESEGSCRGFSLGGWRVIHSTTYTAPIPGPITAPEHTTIHCKSWWMLHSTTSLYTINTRLSHTQALWSKTIQVQTHSTFVYIRVLNLRPWLTFSSHHHNHTLSSIHFFAEQSSRQALFYFLPTFLKEHSFVFKK